MNKKVRVILIIVFAITIVMVIGAFLVANRLKLQNEVEENPSSTDCPAPTQCEFLDCNTQKIYKENCQFDVVAGFCCTGYNSPSDRCEKTTYCKSGEENVQLCEEAGETFETCDRCSAGRSSKVFVKQGEVGCEYDFEICKEDSNCGEIPAQDTIEPDTDNCASDREDGEKWNECCTGLDSGKSRVIRKNTDCSFEVVEECKPDDKCTKPTPVNPSLSTASPTEAIEVVSPTTTLIASTTITNTTPTPSSAESNDNTSINSTPPDITGKSTQIEKSPILTNTATPSQIPSQVVENLVQTTISSPTPTRNSQPTEAITLSPSSNPSPTLPVLPKTDKKYLDAAVFLMGIFVLGIGIHVLTFEPMQIWLESRQIDFKYVFSQHLGENQRKRSRKLFEKKFKKKGPKNKEN